MELPQWTSGPTTHHPFPSPFTCLPKSQSSEFQPISLLSQIGKICGRVVSWFLQYESTIRPNQLGCRAKISARRGPPCSQLLGRQRSQQIPLCRNEVTYLPFKFSALPGLAYHGPSNLTQRPQQSNPSKITYPQVSPFSRPFSSGNADESTRNRIQIGPRTFIGFPPTVRILPSFCPSSSSPCRWIHRDQSAFGPPRSHPLSQRFWSWVLADPKELVHKTTSSSFALERDGAPWTISTLKSQSLPSSALSKTSTKRPSPSAPSLTSVTLPVRSLASTHLFRPPQQSKYGQTDPSSHRT